MLMFGKENFKFLLQYEIVIRNYLVKKLIQLSKIKFLPYDLNYVTSNFS